MSDQMKELQIHPEQQIRSIANDQAAKFIDNKVPQPFRQAAHSIRGAVNNQTDKTLRGIRKDIVSQRVLREKPQPAIAGVREVKKNWWQKLKGSKVGKWVGSAWSKVKAPVKSLVGAIPGVGGLLNAGIDAVEQIGRK